MATPARSAPRSRSSRTRRTFLRLVHNTINRVTTPLARAGRGPWSLVEHTGRRTGRAYATPLLLARTDDGFVCELTYGPSVDWYRNIEAAGGCTVVYDSVEHVIDRIEPCSTEEGLRAFGGVRAAVLRALRRREFRRLHSAGTR